MISKQSAIKMIRDAARGGAISAEVAQAAKFFVVQNPAKIEFVGVYDNDGSVSIDYAGVVGMVSFTFGPNGNDFVTWIEDGAARHQEAPHSTFLGYHARLVQGFEGGVGE